MAAHHAPGFLKLVEDARTRVRTMDLPAFLDWIRKGETFVLVDTREDKEWDAGHVPGAHHMSKGTIERDIEATIPDPNMKIVCYCGGGFRSVLVCDNLQKMGYTNVISLDGGWRGWTGAGLPVTKPGEDEAAE